MTTTPSLFSYEEDCMILCSGMTFRDLADYLFVPIEYVRERHEVLTAEPMPAMNAIPWNRAELDVLRKMGGRGYSWREVSQAVGTRTEGSCRKKFYEVRNVKG